ncbi:hypothetical protein RvY_05470 [Ramazzottius varieornatus]|uniref:Uncharacterized protein n=1 Tax=Ramazzottius varieornatus TaxID=947166 RepID=A0A1D1UV45_RAMVA|nr:hypothetical protein RvY_05470 [Ramazzottius varieornatus]
MHTDPWHTVSFSSWSSPCKGRPLQLVLSTMLCLWQMRIHGKTRGDPSSSTGAKVQVCVALSTWILGGSSRPYMRVPVPAHALACAGGVFCGLRNSPSCFQQVALRFSSGVISYIIEMNSRNCEPCITDLPQVIKSPYRNSKK